MEPVAFIGTGIMGQGMIRNLRRAGLSVQIYSRTRSKAAALEAEGAVWKDTIAACVAGCRAVITMLGFPQDVRQVYFDRDGILDSAAPGTLLIDMTTTSPKLAEELWAAAAERGMSALDAPVSGGSAGAAAGTLAIMAGGSEAAFAEALPLLEAMGKTIVHQGRAGAGQHTKMANQIAIAGAAAGVCEAVFYAEKAGLDPERVVRTIRTGSAASAQLDMLAPKMIAGDLAPTFYLRHFVKDMGIASEESQARGLRLEVLETVLAMYRQLEREGMGDLGTQALIRYYEERD